MVIWRSSDQGFSQKCAATLWMPIFGRNARRIHLICYNFMGKHASRWPVFHVWLKAWLWPSKSAGTVLLTVVTKKATLPCQCLVIKEHPTSYLKYSQSLILTLFIENVFISVGHFHGIWTWKVSWLNYIKLYDYMHVQCLYRLHCRWEDVTICMLFE